MTCHAEPVDVLGSMAIAAIAPALAAALIGLLIAGPPGAVLVFGIALAVAGVHVAILALPLHFLLTLLGWRPGAGTALIAAPVIGGLPAGLLITPGAGIWGGLFGLIGGGAFCAMSILRGEGGE
jgi:hypothetical protein